MLRINNISKMYNKNVGIKLIDIEIEPDEIVCFIGPNGAGKTTLLKVVAGVARCDEGGVYLEDKNTLFHSTKKDIGYMPDELKLYEHMTVYELLDFFNSVKYDNKYDIDKWLYRYEIYEKRNASLSSLSYGMLKKVGLILSLLGDPKLIVLDEPTNGIDTLGIINLKDDIDRLSRKGHIIIVSSHVLDFVSNIGTRFIFLKEGNIMFDSKFTKENYNLENLYRQIY